MSEPRATGLDVLVTKSHPDYAYEESRFVLMHIDPASLPRHPGRLPTSALMAPQEEVLKRDPALWVALVISKSGFVSDMDEADPLWRGPGAVAASVARVEPGEVHALAAWRQALLSEKDRRQWALVLLEQWRRTALDDRNARSERVEAAALLRKAWEGICPSIRGTHSRDGKPARAPWEYVVRYFQELFRWQQVCLLAAGNCPRADGWWDRLWSAYQLDIVTPETQLTREELQRFLGYPDRSPEPAAWVASLVTTKALRCTAAFLEKVVSQLRRERRARLPKTSQ